MTWSTRLRPRASANAMASPGCALSMSAASTGIASSALAPLATIRRTCAGFVTCPTALRTGLSFTTAGPGSIGPVRSLGPARSNEIRQRLPRSRSASRRCLTICAQVSRESCAQLMRMIPMPASTSPRIKSGLSAASPGIVTMMRAWCPCGLAPRMASVCSASNAGPVSNVIGGSSTISIETGSPSSLYRTRSTA